MHGAQTASGRGRRRIRRRSPARIAAAVAAGVLLEAAAMRARGYPIGTSVVVRCRDGHLFTTTWLPGASFKALRLGWWRFQRCPVGHHFTLVTPVREGELTEEQRAAAEAIHDTRIP